MRTFIPASPKKPRTFFKFKNQSLNVLKANIHQYLFNNENITTVSYTTSYKPKKILQKCVLLLHVITS